MSEGPVTLGDLMREGKGVWAYCIDCYRERDLAAHDLPLPPETPVPKIGRHMRCTACGGRNVETKPELYPGGIEAQRRMFR